MKLRTAFSLSSILLSSFSIHAATCSCAGVPLLSSMDAALVNEGQWLLNISYDHHQMNDLYSGKDEVNDETLRSRETDSIITQIDYGINDTWSLSGMLSYVDHQRAIGRSSNSSSSASGIGDGLILAKYTPQRMSLLSRWEYSLGFGAKVPLGESKATQNGVLLSEDMQPSSGSYSLLVWGFAAYALDQAAQQQIFISTSYSINGENDRDYSTGDEFNIGIGASYTMIENWAVSAQVRYRTTLADERNNGEIPNTGGEWVEVLPSVQYRFDEKSALNLGARIPIYRNLDGALQFTTSSAVTLGYSYAF